MENFKFKKAYGQNFLKDRNIITNIVKESNIKPNSLVIEIGPGSGVLTKELSQIAKHVLSYEIDTQLEEILSENLLGCSNVKIIFDDFMKRDVLFDIKDYEYEHIYVVANLPYYITTPIITKLINSKIGFESITIMIQKEVGERWTSKIGSRDYGSITVFLNYYFDIKKLFIVNRNCFVPMPNVDSVVVSLIKKEKPYVKDENLFFKLIRDAFQYKRKNIRNNLKTYNLDVIENVLKKYNMDLTIRAEDISLEIFVDIANNLSK